MVVLRIVVGTEHDDGGAAMSTQQLEAILLAEADIENEDVWCIGRGHNGPCLLEGAANGDDFDPCLATENGGRAVAEDRMVVDDGDSDHAVAGHSTPTWVPR